MTQKVSSDPYERMGNLAPQVRYKTLNHKKLEVFFSNAQEKSYNELFQALLDSLRVAMEETFSQDPVVKSSESKLIKNQESIHSMAEHHSSCYKSLQYIEDRLKEFGYQPPPSTTNHEWCVLS
jgi:Na+/phosphate symporter